MSYDPRDPNNVWGSDAGGNEEQRPRGREKKPRGSRTKEVARTAYSSASKPLQDRGIYDHLAMVFRDAPCYVPQGAPLIARLLQERAQADDLLMRTTVTKQPRPEHRIQDVVEYMIKHFWMRVPNDQRGRALNAFLDEWWDGLLEESLDHQIALALPFERFVPGGAQAVATDPFYEQFKRPEKAKPTGTLRERLDAAIAKQHTTTEEND